MALLGSGMGERAALMFWSNGFHLETFSTREDLVDSVIASAGAIDGRERRLALLRRLDDRGDELRADLSLSRRGAVEAFYETTAGRRFEVTADGYGSYRLAEYSLTSIVGLPAERITHNQADYPEPLAACHAARRLGVLGVAWADRDCLDSPP